MSTLPPVSRVWLPGRPLDLRATWGPLRRGAGDPTWRSAHGSLFRGIRTPSGPVTLQLTLLPAPGPGGVTARAWGDKVSTGWVLEHLPAMLGEHDDETGFDPAHPLVRSAHRAHRGFRVSRTGLVMESLVPAIIEQKVTGQEAFAGFRRMVRRYGTTAPGPGESLGLAVAPAPETLRQVPSWEWLRLGISPQRADTLMRALRVSDRLEQIVDLPLPAARRRLRAVPGIGGWTAAEVCQRALGDADAVSFGDYHVAQEVGYALTGAMDVDDAGLATLLEPYRGHRYRVQRLVQMAGPRRPRHGARMAPRHHLPVNAH